VIEDFEIEHSALGWKKFREKLQPYGSIPFAIETSPGVAVEQLSEAGMIVYPVVVWIPCTPGPAPGSSAGTHGRSPQAGPEDRPEQQPLLL